MKRATRTGLSPATARLSRRFRFSLHGHWPGPRSLATTNGVSVDVLSSGYLDVSVRRVRFLHLCIQYRMTQKGRVSPFGNPRIKDCSHLPTAYRSVLRPSSPLSAKASTKCPSALDCEMSCTGTSPKHNTPAKLHRNPSAPPLPARGLRRRHDMRIAHGSRSRINLLHNDKQPAASLPVASSRSVSGNRGQNQLRKCRCSIVARHPAPQGQKRWWR